MKIIAQLLLFVFISFLITPAVICLIEKDADVTVFYGFSEDEKTQKEIKAIIDLDARSTSIDLSQLNSKLILTRNISKHNNFYSKIFIPPPKQV